MFMLGNRARGPRALLTLFMRSDIPKGLYEWKKETKQTTRDLSILRNYAL